MKLSDNCIYEQLDTSIGMINEDEPVIGSGYLEVAEFEEVKVLDEVIGLDVRETEYIEKAAVPIESVPEEMELEPQIEVIPDDLDVSVVDDFTSIESTDFKADARAATPETYVEYALLSVEEKVELFAIPDYSDSLDVMRLVKHYFQKIGYDYSIDKIMEESNAIYEGARQISIGKNAERICNDLQDFGLSYWYLTLSKKAKLFEFRMDDNYYNLALHTAVLKKLGVDMYFDERYEDYQ